MPRFQSTCPVRGTTYFHLVEVACGQFQSTCPVRGTTSGRRLLQRIRHFNPRAPYGARLALCGQSPKPPEFQSTCPVRGTTCCFASRHWRQGFQSTCPVRGTTLKAAGFDGFIVISIHVPRTGHDPFLTNCCLRTSYFNPRAPYGARRRRGRRSSPWTRYFNPRAPYGARQITSFTSYTVTYFNPRAPYGARPSTPWRARQRTNFNPRAPYGARQQKCTNSILHFCNNRQ